MELRPPQHLGVVAIEKGTFGSSLTKVANLTLLMYIFSCDLWSFSPPVYLLSIWLRGIITITNSTEDNASPRNRLLWIFTLVKLFPPTVSSTLHFCMVVSINFMTLLGILYIFWQSVSSFAGQYHMLFAVNPCHCKIVSSRFAVLEDVLINV